MEGEKSFRVLAERATAPWVKRVFDIISTRAGQNYVADASASPIVHTTDEIREIQRIMYDEVRSRYIADGMKMQTLEECKRDLTGRAEGIVRDGFWNPMSGVGSADDPGMFNFAYTPVSMYPHEATAYYSNGGLGQVIIDKKAKGVLINGYSFEGDGWTPDEIKRLHDYGELVGFGEAVSNGLRDGLIYGGAVVYPRLKGDNVETLEWKVVDLLNAGIITQNCIDHFVVVDRWNTVLVPNWNVTARDYLYPSHYYVPIGGVKVATDRSAVIRPHMLPYWGMLPQIGWGISDFEGYIQSILAYQIVIASIPVMAQQMSLMFHVIPLDGIIAQNGVLAADEFLKQNTQAMQSWSILHPRTINTFGEIKVVERNWSGYDALVMLLRDDIGARSEMPTSVIFPTQPTGMASDRQEDVMLKQAEAVKKIGSTVEPQLKPLARILALSYFGPDYFVGENEKKLATLGVTFESPTIQTAEKQADSGAKFSQMIGQLVTAGMPIDAAMKTTLVFFPDVELPAEVMERIEQLPEGNPPDMVPAPTLAELMEQGQLAQELQAAGGGNGQGQAAAS
jgi:hypothetical protein